MGVRGSSHGPIEWNELLCQRKMRIRMEGNYI